MSFQVPQHNTWSRSGSRQFLTASLLLCSLLCATELSARLADYPTPSWVNFDSVAENMVINGLPSEVYYFSSDRPSEETLNFYRKRWQSHPDYSPGYRESQVSQWTILARTESGKLITLQIQNDTESSSLGYFAIADMSATRTLSKTDVPMPAGSKILNQSITEDGGIKSSVNLISNSLSPEANVDFYLDYYRREGWTNDVHQQENNSVTLIFRRARQEAHLVIRELFGATQIVINTVNK